MKARYSLTTLFLLFLSFHLNVLGIPNCTADNYFEGSGIAEYMDRSSAPSGGEIRAYDPLYIPVPFLSNETYKHIKINKFPSIGTNDLTGDFASAIRDILWDYQNIFNIPDPAIPTTITIEFPSCWQYTSDVIFDTLDYLSYPGYLPCDVDECCIMTFTVRRDTNLFGRLVIDGKTLISSGGPCGPPIDPEGDPCENICSVFDEIVAEIDPLEHAPCFESCGTESIIFQGAYGKQIEYSDGIGNTVIVRPKYEIAKCYNGDYQISMYGLELLSTIEGDYNLISQKKLTQYLIEYALTNLTDNDQTTFTVNFKIPCMTKTPTGYELCDPEDCCEYTFDMEITGPSNNREKQINNVTNTCGPKPWSHTVPSTGDFAINTPIDMGSWIYDFPDTEYISPITRSNNDLTSKEVGTLDGTLNITALGAAVYTVPLFVAPGTMGMEPDISLVYNSNAGNGMAGWGWNIDALSVIKRSGKDRYNDNFSEEMKFVNLDKLALDGERLIVVSGAEGQNGAVYKTESDNSRRILPQFSTATGYSWFKVEYKDGSIVEYGRTTNSRQIVKDGTIGWYINKITDHNGNYIEYEYFRHKGQTIISEINYTGNGNGFLFPYANVKFSYSKRKDKNEQYFNGDVVTNELILESLESKIDNQLVRKYEFNYVFEHFSKLHEVVEIGSDNSRINSLLFDNYQVNSNSDLAQEVEVTGEIPGLHNSEYKYYVFGDYNGDGYKDRVIIERDWQGSASNDARWHLQYGKYYDHNDAQSTFDFDDPSGGTVLFITVDYYKYNHELLRHWIFSGDINNDGYDDMIVPFYEQNINNNYQDDFYNLAHSYQKLRFKIYLSDGQKPVYQTGKDIVMNLYEWIPAPDKKDRIHVIRDIKYADFDADGVIEIVPVGYVQQLLTDINGKKSYDGRQDIKISLIKFLDSQLNLMSNPVIDIDNHITNKNYPEITVHMGRFNSNGKPDLYIAHDNQHYGGNFYEIGNTGSFQHIDGFPTLVAGGENSSVGDFNGDGLTDVIYKPNRSRNWQLLLNNGEGFEQQQEVWGEVGGWPLHVLQDGHIEDNDDPEHHHYIVVNDFNGDGLDDILDYIHERDNGNTINFRFFYSKGYNEVFHSNGNIHLTQNFIYRSKTLTTADTDRQYVLSNRSERHKDHGTRYWSKFYIDDFNGDGNIDFYLEDRNIGSTLMPDKLIMLVPGEHANHVKTITESHNNKYELYYNSITHKNIDGGSIHTKKHDYDNDINVINKNSGLFAVSSYEYYKASDYTTPILEELFYYSGALMHWEKGFLGYSDFTVFRTTNDWLTFDWDYQEFKLDEVNLNTNNKPLYDLDLIKQDVNYVDNYSGSMSLTTISTTDLLYDFSLTNSVYNKYANSVTTKYHDPNIEVKSTSTQDQYHNITYSKEETKDLNTSTVTSYSESVNTYIKHTPGGHWDNLLKTSEVRTKHKDDSNIFKLKTTNNYNHSSNKYLLTSKVLEDLNHTDPNEDVTQTETFTYDAFGNILTIVESVSDPLETLPNRTRSNTYDTKGRFIVSVTNPLNQTSTKEYNNIGMVTKETDIEGNYKTYQYNGFGTVTSTSDNFGMTLNANIDWVANHPNPGNYPSDALIYTENTPATNVPGVTVTNFMNSLEQIIRIESEVPTETGVKTTWVDKEYNNAGKIIKETSPYFTADDPDRIIEYKYEEVMDQLSEMKNRSFDNTESLITTYDNDLANRKVTVTDPDLRTTIQVTDAAGNLIESYDQANNIVYKKYASNGKVRNIETVLEDGVGGEKISVNIHYDNFGRKKKLEDPDAGDFEYFYNAYGELKKQTNPNGRSETKYDVLGRPTEIKQYDALSNLENTIDYTYVSSGAGIGQVYTISDDISTTTYVYNGNGQLTSTSEVVADYNNNQVASQNFMSSYTYDSFGRPLTETVESGHTFENFYDTGLGYLKEVKHKINSTTYKSLWKFKDGDEYGRIIKYERGYDSNNNPLIVDVRGFDDVGFPTKTESYLHANNNTKLIDYSYLFDHNETTLTSRTNNKGTSKTESFQYDDLNMLKKMTHNSNVINIPYNKDGSIQSKTGIGNYVYGNTDNHKLTDLTNSTIVEGGSNIVLQDKTINYNSFNSIDDISQGIYSTDFTYRYDGQRIGKYESENGVLQHAKYYRGNYEREILGTGGTKEIIYVPNTNGEVVLVKITGTNASENYYYPTYDYLGSLISLTDDQGSILEEYSYDAWGRMRKHDDWTYYVDETGLNYFDVLGRGYTHHEHMSQYRLINMNGRVYDQILGQFIQPDNNVQLADHTLGYNRYSYVFNNPLSYTDPSGEDPLSLGIAMLIASAVSTTTNGIQNEINGKPFFHGAGWAAFSGGMHGAISYGIGGAAEGMSGIKKIAFQTLAHGHLGGLSAVANGGKYSVGFVSGGIGSLAATGTGYLLRNQNQILQISGMIGSGALSGGMTSSLYGGDFWIGFRNGFISSATNHALHLTKTAVAKIIVATQAFEKQTFGGRNWLLSKLPGIKSNSAYPDAVAIQGYGEAGFGPHISMEYGILIILRGENMGIYPILDGALGLSSSFEGGIEYLSLFSTSDNPTLDDFLGIRWEGSVGVDILGVSAGLAVNYSNSGGSKVYGIGFDFGVGGSVFQLVGIPALFDGSINWGSTNRSSFFGWKGTSLFGK